MGSEMAHAVFAEAELCASGEEKWSRSGPLAATAARIRRELLNILQTLMALPPHSLACEENDSIVAVADSCVSTATKA